MAVDRTPPGTSKKKSTQPKSSTASASRRQPSAPPPSTLNTTDLESIIWDSNPQSPTGSEKSPRTSGRNRTPLLKQKEATNDDVNTTTNKELALVTPKKRKSSKNNDDDNSPSKKPKPSRKHEKQSTLESDAETNSNDQSWRYYPIRRQNRRRSHARLGTTPHCIDWTTPKTTPPQSRYKPVSFTLCLPLQLPLWLPLWLSVYLPLLSSIAKQRRPWQQPGKPNTVGKHPTPNIHPTLFPI